jgi:hypothetical protein
MLCGAGDTLLNPLRSDSYISLTRLDCKTSRPLNKSTCRAGNRPTFALGLPWVHVGTCPKAHVSPSATACGQKHSTLAQPWSSRSSTSVARLHSSSSFPSSPSPSPSFVLPLHRLFHRLLGGLTLLPSSPSFRCRGNKTASRPSLRFQ